MTQIWRCHTYFNYTKLGPQIDKKGLIECTEEKWIKPHETLNEIEGKNIYGI